MVAYSFAPQFVHEVESLIKRQTVRAYRKRHAQAGEAIQLYTGMRTRQCRKLVDPDPICVGAQHILIAQSSQRPLMIELDGILLDSTEVEAFAIADGFANPADRCDGRAAERMAAFWLKYHGPECFAGVVIRWRPS